MRKVWFLADTHFGHKDTILNWRPQFSSTEEMCKVIVDNVCRVVKPTDTLYLAGDIVISQVGMQYLERLPGYKILVPGNHDGERGIKLADYPVHKILVAASVTVNKIPFVVTHIPVHTSEVEDRWKGNIHGHLHDKIIDDSRYVNVSCEQTGYAPVDKDYINEQYSLIR